MLKDPGPDGTPLEAASGRAFVGILEPLPVGTRLTLKTGEAVREARVEEVVESSEPAVAGMRVHWGEASPAAVRGPEPVAPAPLAVNSGDGGLASNDSGPVPADSGPTPSGEAGDEGSDAIPAPLSLAGAGAGAQPGGGKRRRKRR